MAKILLIETSSEVCSAAISEGGVVVALFENPDTQHHAALLTLQVRECAEAAGIALAELDAVALSQGPGSYTALRVGASVAKGICYALDKPLIAVDTLRALADACRTGAEGGLGNGAERPKPELLVPVLDARRQEVWLAAYDGALQEMAPAQPLVLENNSFEKFVSEHTGGVLHSGVVLAGNGIEKIRSGGFSGKASFSEIKKCSARHLARLAEQIFQSGDFQDIAYFEPHYMKPPNITISNKALF